MLNRRAFFGRLAGAFVAALASPTLLELLPAPAAPALALHPDAFGISMRFIEKWDHSADALRYSRLDVLYGVANQSAFACRIGDELTVHCKDGIWHPEPRGSFAAYLAADQDIQNDLIYDELWAQERHA